MDKWNRIDNTLEELISMQHQTLLATGRRLVPTLTTEDALQPHDYPELECFPPFRYEEGLLTGLMTAQTAIRALKNEN